jgi:fluoride exporter
MLRTYAVVAVGGALGAVARYAVGEAFSVSASSFPWPTFAINVVGSFLLALLPGFRAVRTRPLLPPFLGAGVLGGFTTLSAYCEQTRSLLDTGHSTTAGAYLLGTLAAALVAVAVANRLSTLRERTEFEAEEGDR